MSACFKKSLLALSVSYVFMASSAFATNGYFAHGYSTKEKGLAGAGVAYSTDALAAATNPAGMVKVGARMDVGMAIFNPNREYTASNPSPDATIGTTGFPAFKLMPGTYESSNDFFLVPSFGYNWMLDSVTSFGISAYGNGGMNSDYRGVKNLDNTGTQVSTGTYGGGAAGVNLMQLFVNATYAKQINSSNSVGASLVFALQAFKATGLANFGGFSSDASKLTNNGTDTSMGLGVKLGWQGDVSSNLTLGVSYQTKVSMSEFKDYAGLFAEGGDFDIPATMTAGIAWSVNDSSTLVLDMQQIYYSDVGALGNGIEQLFACGMGDSTGCLGGANGGGFGWEDMTVIKIGYEWESGENIYRVGFSNGSQPISKGQNLFNILAPAVIETHLTFGLTMPLSSDTELSFAGLYAPSNSIKGPTQFDNAQTVELKMDQIELQATYSKKF